MGDPEVKGYEDMDKKQQEEMRKTFGVPDEVVSALSPGPPKELPKELPEQEEPKQTEPGDPDVAQNPVIVGGRRFCPQCGFDTNDALGVEVSPEDKANFIKFTVMGGNPFEKDYKLFGGKLMIRLIARSEPESVVLWNQLDIDITKQRIVGPQAQILRLEKYQAVINARSIGFNGASAVTALTQWNDDKYREMVKNAELAPSKKTDDTTEEVPPNHELDDTPLFAAAKHKFKGLSEALFHAICMANRNFELLVNVLTRRALDPDFWISESDTSS